MDERVLHEQPGAKITTTRAVLRGTTYPIAGITSVRIRTNSASLAGPMILALSGCIGLLLALVFGYGAHTSGPVAFAGISGILGACLLGAAVLMLFSAATTYVVILGTAGGDRAGFATPRKVEADAVRAALEEAIVGRG